MLGQRRVRWANNKATLGRRIMFARYIPSLVYPSQATGIRKAKCPCESVCQNQFDVYFGQFGI